MIGEEWPRETPSRPHGASIIAATLSGPQPDTTVCTVTGTVNWDTMRVVRDALAEARLDDNAHLVIDLSTVTSMDAAGPYTLLEARFRHNLAGGGHLAVVVDTNSQAIPELHIVALKATFDFHSNLADALHACASSGRKGDPVTTAKALQSDRRSLTHRPLLVASQTVDK